MLLKFTGRETQLNDVAQLVKAKQGAVFAVSGNAGIGKSSLLKEVAQRYPKTGQVFIDINNVPPLQTATEFLQFFAKQAKGLDQTKKALAKINGTYKNTADLIAPYKEVFQQTTDLATTEHQKNLPDDIKDNVTTYAALVWKILCIVFSLGMIYWKLKQEEEKEKLKDPEKYFLDALKKDCANHPLIFIDTYERLQAAQELSQQPIKSLYAHLNERLSPVSKTLSLQDWLERLIDFLTANGAIVLIAGRRISRRDWKPQDLARFTDEEILDVVGNSEYTDLQALSVEEQTEQALLSLLKRLSFGGIPLWLQLALNFVDVELPNAADITELAIRPDVEMLFANPIIDSNWEKSANIENATCKLALFKHVFRHNPELEEQAWKMALPRRLDKAVLQILFSEQAQTIYKAFVNTGLLTAMRWEFWEEGKPVSLHHEIWDLLLAYAKYKNWLETEETKVLHQQLAELFAQRYQKNADIQLLLEQLYHDSKSNRDNYLKYGNDSNFLWDCIKSLNKEQRYAEMLQASLRLLELEPEHENAWNSLGAALAGTTRFNEAIYIYKQQLKVNPTHRHSWINLGLTLDKLESWDEAIKAYEERLIIDPKDERAWGGLIVPYWHKEKWDKLIKAYREKLDITPEDENSLNGLGLILSQQEKWNEAIDAFHSLIKINCRNEFVWYNLATALTELGRFEEVENAYKKQIEITPHQNDIWVKLGVALIQLNKLDEAIDNFKKQLKTNQKNEIELSNCIQSEDFIAYQNQIKSTYEASWLGLSFVYLKQKNFKEAQEAFAKLLEINPQNISYLSNDAELALIQQDKNRCLQRIQQALLLVDNKDDLYAILPFLAWLAEPENSYQPVLTAIAQLDSSVKITWDFTDTEPAILRLTPAQQTIARQFIAYFQGTGELPPQPLLEE